MKKNKVKFLFEKRLSQVISEKELIGCGQTVLVAFSGGIDSVVMLFALKSVSKKLGFLVKAAHINHGIRKTAERDEAFAQNFANDLGIPFVSRKADVPAEAKRLGKGIEETARIIRYSILDNIAIEFGADLIATAHNKNDNAETVLFNIIRGSGLNGLCGISEKRGQLIRPMLDFTRAEIESYAAFCGLNHVEDETNSDTTYTRNFLRHNILPLINQINPNAIENISKLSKAAKDDLLLIQNIINEKNVNERNPSLLYRKLINEYSKYSSRTLETVHLRSIEKAIRKTSNSIEKSEISLPDKITAVVSGGEVKFLKNQNIISHNNRENDISENSNSKIVLRMGENRYNNYRILICDSKNNECENIYNNSIQFTLDFDKINRCIFVRARESGDSFVCHGINRNLKKCFINAKIPREKRKYVPVICDENGIICVPKIGIADRVYSKHPKNPVKIIILET